MNIKNIRPAHRNITVITIIIGLALATGVGLMIWFVLQSPRDTADTDVTPQSIDAVVAKGMEYSEKGDVNGGLKYYDEQIEKTQDKDVKQTLLLSKSDFAAQEDRPEVALQAAKQADSLKSDIPSLYNLAELYESQGDKQKALEYYQMILDKSLEMGGSPRSDDRWRLKIEELSS